MNTRITVNASETDIIRAREALLTGYGGIDSKRPTAWAQYGYTEHPSFDQFLRAYERGGAGHGAVHRLLDKCWEMRPTIRPQGANSDTITPLQRQIDDVMTAARVWPALRDLDRRNMVGRYAALIYRVADSKPLRDPMDRAQKLVAVVPVWESQLRVTVWDTDEASVRYGMPVMYQYQSQPVSQVDTQAQPVTWTDVHHTRVQIMAEGGVGDMFAGVPLLKAGFNSLVDIEKISGGSGESFLKNSARTLVFEYDPSASVVTNYNADGTVSTPAAAHEEQARKLNTNQDSSVVIQGGKASTLQTSVSDPTGAFQLAANLFSASVQIPFTVLFGQQTGRLASDQDQKDFAARCKSRQINELTPMLTEFIERMQAAGIIATGAFEVVWPDLLAESDTEKLNKLDKMTAALERAARAGVLDLFSADEMRAVIGMK